MIPTHDSTGLDDLIVREKHDSIQYLCKNCVMFYGECVFLLNVD